MMLEWVNQAVEAPDLETLGRSFDRELWRHTEAGAPSNEEALVVRLGLEHQVRTFLARAYDRCFPVARVFPEFSTRWVAFVDQNKAAEAAFSSQSTHA
ncbi:hypothetical protein M9H71_25090, partial [Rhodopseudomonas parapalustris]